MGGQNVCWAYSHGFWGFLISEKTLQLRADWVKVFFGTLFIAAATSLPEVVVSIAAIRLGTIDLAIGNIFGSNIFNISILALDDIL